MYTANGAWMSGEENRKGALEPGKLADLIILSADYFTIPEEEIKDLESVLTVVGGRVVYGAGPYSRLDPPLPPVAQDWLPVKDYGQYYKRAARDAPKAAAALREPGIIGDAGVWGEGCGCGIS
jgi:hypothetical protein